MTHAGTTHQRTIGRRAAAALTALGLAGLVGATLAPAPAAAVEIPLPDQPASVIFADTGEQPTMLQPGQVLEVVPGTWTVPPVTRTFTWWDCPTAPAPMHPDTLATQCTSFATGVTAAVPDAVGHTMVVGETVAADGIAVWALAYSRWIVEPYPPVTPAGITAGPGLRGIAFRIPAQGGPTYRITVDGVSRDVTGLGAGGSYLWTGFTAGTTHTWSVQATTTSHGAVWQGAAVSGTVVSGFLKPYAPTKLKVTWKRGGVGVLTWIQRSDALHPYVAWHAGFSPTTFRKKVYTRSWTFTQKVVGKPFRVYVRTGGQMGASPVASLLTKRPR